MLTKSFASHLLSFLLLPFCHSLPQVANSNGPCKATPSSSSWPSKAQWNLLNSSISGQLLAPLPPAAVCHPSLPVFNNASCAYVSSQWTVSDFHAKDPTSVNQPNLENDACLPNAQYPCNLQQFPNYVINATEMAHVQAGVVFARLQNVRLIVKGTGHDYLGRSTAPDCLSIWTHNLRGIQYSDHFIPTGCPANPTPALTVAAGHRMFEIYAAASAYNKMVVGGDDANVGLGGYLTGGGHSPISGQYGLAADNVLELKVVDPSGVVQTLNPCLNPDLFFAFRGGGGSTFGVLLSATLRIIPMPSVSSSQLTITQNTADSSTFWDAIAYFHSQLPYLVKNGMSGYYTINTPASPTTFQLSGGFTILNASIPAFNAVFSPILNNLSTSYSVDVTNQTQYAPTFYEYWKAEYPDSPVAFADFQLGGRLLDEKALSTPLPSLAENLRAAFGGVALIFNLVSGPGVWNAKPPGGLGAMTPAWRTAVVETLVPVGWEPFDAAAKAQQTSLLTNSYMAALRTLAPDTGAYLNEADINEPNYPQAFWGANYPRLLSIKRQVDPNGVFWCSPCVGSQDWTLNNGQLCRA